MAKLLDFIEAMGFAFNRPLRGLMAPAERANATFPSEPFMRQVALVFIGAGLGGIARYKLGGLILHRTTDWRFPLGTFVVNVLGCLLAGVIAGLIVRQDWFSPDVRVFLLTGALGGFTTFSAFGVECIYLLQRGEIGIALAYVSLSLLVGVAAVGMGMALVPPSAT